jgi:Iron-binding zinc finger CDGSH type
MPADRLMPADWQVVNGAGEDVDLEPCGDGPVLARHASVVIDSAGIEHAVTRPVVALCTCGKSQRAPWCDSTHKSVRRRPQS